MGKKQKTYSTEVKARVALEALRGKRSTNPTLPLALHRS